MIREALFSPPDLPVWLLRLVFSVTLVCAAAVFVNMLLRRSSAAMRHRVWALSIAGSLAMPAIIFWFPEVRLGWLSVTAPRATVALESPRPSDVPSATPSDQWAHHVVDARRANSNVPPRNVLPPTSESHPSPAPAPNPVATPIETRPESPATNPRILTADATRNVLVSRALDHNVLWMLMLIVPAACGLWQSVRCARGARRVVEEAQLIRDAATQELVADVCRRLGWNGSLELRQTLRTPIPLCVGWRKPCVLLPPEWRSWGDLTLRAVLAHEVSHIVRRDVAWQFAARIACFLYWFHPLVWLAARKMRIERESACDDSVLEMVDQPVDYASVLLRFAREMVARSSPTAAALPMAGLSGLEGRVQAILDRGRRRSKVGARAGRIFAGAAMLIAAGAASLSPLSWEVPEVMALDAPTGGLAAQQPFRAAAPWPAEERQADVRPAGELKSAKPAPAGDISGRVVLKADPQQGAARARILGIPENPKATYVTAVADGQGKFRVPRSRSVMLFLAQNDERTISGIARVEPEESNVVIPVSPPVSARGRLLDSTGKPLPSYPMEYCLVVEGSFLDEFHVYQARDAKRLLGGNASTGANGEFVVPGLAPGWTYRISCCPGTMLNGSMQPFVTLATFTPAQSGITQLGDVKRPRTDTVDDIFLSASTAPRQFERALESATAEARMLDKRVLVVAGSRKNEIVRAVRAFLALSAPVPMTLPMAPGKDSGSGEPSWAKDLPGTLFNYSIVGLEVAAPGAKTATFLERHKLTPPATDDVTLAALDIDGRLIAQTSGQQLFSGKKSGAEPLAAWLHKHARKLPDAEKLLADALAQAKQENKRVFLREISPAADLYCSPLERYLERYKPLIEKDYVCLKIDARCAHTDAVMSRIRDYGLQDYSATGGVTFPWMVILDAAGKPLVSGTSPRGNIGHPESAQETSYFAWMLRATSQRLTEEEITTLVSGLNKNSH
jgi:beta-lactamase regulating signal transducer with metallopeptidase domain